MLKTPVSSSAMNARLETTLDNFHVASLEERIFLKNSLLKLKEAMRRSPRTKFKPQDIESRALFGMYAFLETST